MIDLRTLPEQPMAHQREDMQCALREYFALFHEMGVGKTFSAILHALTLHDAQKIDAVLVVAPKGTYRTWSDEQLPKHLPRHIQRHIAYWTPSPTVAERDSIAKAMLRTDPGRLVWLVMNVEAFSTRKGQQAAERFLRAHRTMLVVDEATTIKSRTAERTKAILGLRNLAPYRRILTGTPVTKNPLDLYCPCLFLSQDALGSNSYYAFRARFAKLAPKRIVRWDTRRQERTVRTVQEVVGYRNLDALQAILSRFSTRRLKSECVDLPEKVYTRRVVELSTEQRRLYAEMRDKARATLEGEVRVTATMAISQILRLHQIACGFLGGEVPETLPNHRMDVLLDVLAETDGKAIVWCTYTHDVQAVERALSREYGSGSVVSYYGATPDAERPGRVAAFQQRETGPRFFVGQPRTGGYGLTLTAASTVVYYSNSYDLEIRLQSEDRAHRHGQRNAVTYVDLVAPGTVDERILASLRAKRSLADLVLGDSGEGWRDWI